MHTAHLERRRLCARAEKRFEASSDLICETTPVGDRGAVHERTDDDSDDCSTFANEDTELPIFAPELPEEGQARRVESEPRLGQTAERAVRREPAQRAVDLGKERAPLLEHDRVRDHGFDAARNWAE